MWAAYARGNRGPDLGHPDARTQLDPCHGLDGGPLPKNRPSVTEEDLRPRRPRRNGGRVRLGRGLPDRLRRFPESPSSGGNRGSRFAVRWGVCVHGLSKQQIRLRPPVPGTSRAGGRRLDRAPPHRGRFPLGRGGSAGTPPGGGAKTGVRSGRCRARDAPRRPGEVARRARGETPRGVREPPRTAGGTESPEGGTGRARGSLGTSAGRGGETGGRTGRRRAGGTSRRPGEVARRARGETPRGVREPPGAA